MHVNHYIQVAIPCQSRFNKSTQEKIMFEGQFKLI